MQLARQSALACPNNSASSTSEMFVHKKRQGLSPRAHPRQCTQSAGTCRLRFAHGPDVLQEGGGARAQQTRSRQAD